MPSLKSIRTQIASKKSTQNITRAMKLVSAARLRGAQDAIVAARPYANALREVIGQVAERAGAEAHLSSSAGRPCAHHARPPSPPTAASRRLQRQRHARRAPVHDGGTPTPRRHGESSQEGPRLYRRAR